MRIVGEPEAFFGPSDQVAIEFHVAILVVKGDDAVVAGREVIERDGRVMGRSRNRLCLVLKGAVNVFGPSGRRCEEENSCDAASVAKAVDMDAQRADRRLGVSTAGD